MDELDIYWVLPAVIAGASMPFIHPDRHDAPSWPTAFRDELNPWWNAGVRSVASLLNTHGMAPVFRAAGFAYLCLPILDGCAPTDSQFRQFLEFVCAQRAVGNPVVVHCEAGVGRTGTLLAAYLIQMGESAPLAIATIRKIRPGAIETQQQMQFLHSIAAARLEREP